MVNHPASLPSSCNLDAGVNINNMYPRYAVSRSMKSLLLGPGVGINLLTERYCFDITKLANSLVRSLDWEAHMGLNAFMTTMATRA